MTWTDRNLGMGHEITRRDFLNGVAAAVGGSLCTPWSSEAALAQASGPELSAAQFFRKAVGPKASILILDNHDDFGGHAKRNEFQRAGRMLMRNGGTLNIEAPKQYSASMNLLRRIQGRY
jgi:hypothetical protein